MSAPCTVTWWRSLTDPNGREETLSSWENLFELFASAPEFGGKEHPGWSPARFDPCRRSKETVRSVFALCLDYDGGETLEAAEELWGGCYGLIHSSRSHTPDSHCFRVILPLARPVSPFEFEALWRRVNRHAGGDKLDQAPKDPSRFWFTPGTGSQEGAEYRTIRLDGRPIDPDEWLAKPEPAPQQPQTEPSRLEKHGDVEGRAIAYIAKMPPAISGQKGHQAAWSVAVVLARGFGLPEDKTLSILREYYNPRCEPPWSERELAHKAKGAAAAQKVPEGFLLKDDRDWEPKRYSLPRAPRWADDEPDYTDDDAPPEQSVTRLKAVPSNNHSTETAQPVDNRSAVERHGFRSMRSLIEEVVTALNQTTPEKGIPTGHEELDMAIAGYRRGNVTVFGAKRNWGKSLYGNLVVDNAIPDKNVLLFAGEDASMIYGKRFLARRASLNAMMLRDNRVNKEDWSKITRALESAPSAPFFVRVDGRPVEWIGQVVREVAKEMQIDLIVVDYLQCIKSKRRHQDRRNEVTYVCKSISDAVKTVGAAGLIFSQLKRGDKVEPDIEDLKESGDIEDMADHILLAWKTGGGNVPVKRFIKVAKNKDGIEAGELAPVTMGWDGKTANFVPTRASGDVFRPEDFADGPEAPRSTLYDVIKGGAK